MFLLPSSDETAKHRCRTRHNRSLKSGVSRYLFTDPGPTIIASFPISFSIFITIASQAPIPKILFRAWQEARSCWAIQFHRVPSRHPVPSHGGLSSPNSKAIFDTVWRTEDAATCLLRPLWLVTRRFWTRRHDRLGWVTCDGRHQHGIPRRSATSPCFEQSAIATPICTNQLPGMRIASCLVQRVSYGELKAKRWELTGHRCEETD